MIGLPGATMSGWAAVGGSITAGWLIDTRGRHTVLADDPGAVGGVEVGLAGRVDRTGLGRQVPSMGTVISCDHVVLLAPTTSGVTRKV